MTETGRHIAVGLTTLAGLVGLAVMSVLFGGVPDLLQPGYIVTLRLPEASGLTRDSRVHLSGIDIGKVMEVKLAQPPDTGVVATLKIQEQYRVPADGQFKVAQASLIGGSPLVTIDAPPPDPQTPTTFLPTDGSAEVRGQAASMVSDLAKQLEESLAEPMAKLNEVTANFADLSKAWTRVGNNLGDLTDARRPEDVDAGDLPANLASTLARADQRLKEMREILQGINSWASDPDLRANIKATAANAEQLTAKAVKSVDKVDATIDNANTAVTNATNRLNELADKYGKAADELTTTIASLRQTIELARKGDGTVGKMLNDPALYNNLNDTVERMGTALEEMKRMFEKWQKEGLPVKL